MIFIHPLLKLLSFTWTVGGGLALDLGANGFQTAGSQTRIAVQPKDIKLFYIKGISQIECSSTWRSYTCLKPLPRTVGCYKVQIFVVNVVTCSMVICVREDILYSPSYLCYDIVPTWLDFVWNSTFPSGSDSQWRGSLSGDCVRSLGKFPTGKGLLQGRAVCGS